MTVSIEGITDRNPSVVDGQSSPRSMTENEGSNVEQEYMTKKREKIPSSVNPKRVTQHVPYVDTSSGRKHYAHVPKEVDEILVPLVAKHHPKTPRFIDHYRWIIHSICFQRFIDRRLRDPSIHVHLNMEILRRIISQRFASAFIKKLEEECILEVNPSYKPSHYSRSYRLTKRFRESPVHHFEITDKGVGRNLERFLTEKSQKARAHNEGYAHVEHWVQRIAINSPCATAFTQTHYADRAEEHEARLRSIRGIELGQLWFTVDDTAGRAHHNFSNLAADLRQFVTIQGEVLHQVDIASSQPWLLHLQLRGSISNEVEQQDMERLLLSGRFYEAFGTVHMKRKDIKEKFFQMLFGQINISSTIAKTFRKRFPSYARAMDEAKRDDYKQVAILLQRAEVEVVFDAVTRFVAMAGTNAPVLTVHDSLATTAKNIHTARDALAEAFKSRYGVVPMLMNKSPFEFQDQHSCQVDNTKRKMKTSQLTCVSIENSGLIKTKFAELIRYVVRFKEGLQGEYWAKSEASEKHFPLHEAYWYKYEPLTKKGEADTLKFRPCKMEEIPADGVGDTVPPHVKTPQRQVQMTEKKVPPTLPVVQKEGGSEALVDTNIVAFESAMKLAVAGKIDVDQIGPTAQNLRKLINGLTKGEEQGCAH